MPKHLVDAVAAEPRLEYAAIIQELFPRWGSSAKEAALKLLSQIDDVAAARILMQLLREHASDISSPPLASLQRRPRYPETFFPGLFEFIRYDAFASDVFLTTLAFCEKGLLPADQLASYAAPLLAAYRRERDWLRPKQRDNGVGWMWEGEYGEHRRRAAILLDLFRCVPPEAVEADLLDATSLRDPRLVYFAVASLLEQGKPVSTRALTAVAASPEMRGSLYELLKMRQKLELFPPRYLTQEAFAESEMVRWLMYPAELGRAPDEIELKKVVSADSGGPDGILDYYVFRFRTFERADGAKARWLAGVAGPFLRKDAPSPTAYGDTFSAFESWEAKTAEQHVGDIRELLDNWAAHHAKASDGGKQ